MIHTVKGSSIVNEAEVDVFLELSCFLDDPTNVGSLISGPSAFFPPLLPTSSVFSKSSLNIWKLSMTLLVCEMTAIIWKFEDFLALPFFEIGMKCGSASLKSW